jgi:hypothetical protein
MLNDINIWDLYRTNYGGPYSTAKEPKDRLASTIIDGETLTYKRGHTVAERTPWLKGMFGEDHPMLTQILGDGLSDYLNRMDVRGALNIPKSILSY